MLVEKLIQEFENVDNVLRPIIYAENCLFLCVKEDNRVTFLIYAEDGYCDGFGFMFEFSEDVNTFLLTLKICRMDFPEPSLRVVYTCGVKIMFLNLYDLARQSENLLHTFVIKLVNDMCREGCWFLKELTVGFSSSEPELVKRYLKGDRDVVKLLMMNHPLTNYISGVTSIRCVDFNYEFLRKFRKCIEKQLTKQNMRQIIYFILNKLSKT